MFSLSVLILGGTFDFQQVENFKQLARGIKRGNFGIIVEGIEFIECCE